MAFKVKHGGPADVAKLAKLAGESEKGKREEAMAFEISQNLARMQHDTKIKEMSLAAELTAREQQINFDLAKMQIAQQNSFMVREEVRMNKMRDEAMKQQRKGDEYDAAIGAVEDSEILSPDEKERMKVNLTAKHNVGSFAPQVDMPDSSADERLRLSQAAGQRAQEAHDVRMADEPTFAEQAKAVEILEEYPEPKWYKPFDQLSDAQKQLRAEAQNVLQSRTVTSAPAPQSQDDFLQVVAQLKVSDPVKARQYYDQYSSLFK